MKLTHCLTNFSFQEARRFFAIAVVFCCVAPMSLFGDSLPYSHGNPTNLEQYQLELINAARAKPTAQAAKLRIDLNEGLPDDTINTESKQPLAFHPKLLKTARGHSDWMLEVDKFEHVGLNDSDPTKRAKVNRYKFSVAENITYRSTSGTINIYDFTLGTHEDLFKSSSHRLNLMDPSFSVVGLGLKTGLFLHQPSGKELNTLMVTQNFSSGGNSIDSGPFLVGVVYNDQNNNGYYDPGEGLKGVRVEPNYGGYYALTSQSGGYAVPLPPPPPPPLPFEIMEQYEPINLPFPVNKPSSWQDARPYDLDFRKSKIEASPVMTVNITWSGGGIPQTFQSIVTIHRPVHINYRLIGTDNYYYDRTMVSSLNVKADFNLANPPPRITTQPKSLIAVAGSSARFSVTASGNNLTYQWSKNGKPIKGATGAVFEISSAKPSNTGNYAVIVSNSGGKTMSKAAKLTVR